MGGFFIADLVRLINYIKSDGGVRMWFEFGGDGRGVANVRFVLADGSLAKVSYRLETDEQSRTRIRRIVEYDDV